MRSLSHLVFVYITSWIADFWRLMNNLLHVNVWLMKDERIYWLYHPRNKIFTFKCWFKTQRNSWKKFFSLTAIKIFSIHISTLPVSINIFLNFYWPIFSCHLLKQRLFYILNCSNILFIFIGNKKQFFNNFDYDEHKIATVIHDMQQKWC